MDKKNKISYFDSLSLLTFIFILSKPCKNPATKSLPLKNSISSSSPSLFPLPSYWPSDPPLLLPARSTPTPSKRTSSKPSTPRLNRRRRGFGCSSKSRRGSGNQSSRLLCVFWGDRDVETSGVLIVHSYERSQWTDKTRNGISPRNYFSNICLSLDILFSLVRVQWCSTSRSSKK